MLIMLVGFNVFQAPFSYLKSMVKSPFEASNHPQKHPRSAQLSAPRSARLGAAGSVSTSLGGRSSGVWEKLLQWIQLDIAGYQFPILFVGAYVYMYVCQKVTPINQKKCMLLTPIINLLTSVLELVTLWCLTMMLVLLFDFSRSIDL